MLIRYRQYVIIISVILAYSSVNKADSADHELVKLFYDLEVIGYCGLAAPDLEQGFQREMNAIQPASRQDPAVVEAARIEAWKQAHAEWQNRGLGGFRNWCKTEGVEALERFRSVK